MMSSTNRKEKAPLPSETCLHLLALICALTLSLPSTSEASPELAESLTQNYELSYESWLSELERAPNEQARRIVMAKRPDLASYSTRLKTLISESLSEPWTLEYASWLLENDIALDYDYQVKLLDAVEGYHLLRPEVGRFALAMIHLREASPRAKPNQPSTLTLRGRGMDTLEVIKRRNPQPSVQGQAALAISIMLSAIGDDGVIMKRRLENIREAVIKSEGTTIGNLAVNDLIKEELYKINNLSKGAKAPNIVGTDSARRHLELSSYQGRVVMLVFWSAWDKSSITALEILKKAHESKPSALFAILGVNTDDFMTLRRMEAENMIEWKSFSDPQKQIAKQYRMRATPYCIVLDKQGMISYRGNVGSFANAVVDGLLSARPGAAK